MSGREIAPYRILFPLGALHCFLGAFVWLLFGMGWTAYPGMLHPHLMVQGFFFSFITGFMMTAIPRFLGAPLAKTWEVAFAALGCASPWIFFFFPSELRFLWLLAFFQISWMIYFGLSRFFLRTFPPPPSFIILPFGIVSGLTGSLMMFFGNAHGRVLLFEGIVLAFVFGIGSKLVASLLGWQKPITIEIETRRKNALFDLDRWMIVNSVLFLSGFLCHAMGSSQSGDFFWAITAVSIAIEKWKLYRRPLSRGVLAVLLWLACWSIVLGLLLSAAAPVYRIHLMHLVYVSGMGLMTFGVGTRVILAHGGHSLELEEKSKWLLSVGIMFFLAALTRATAPLLSTDSYFHHLTYASGILCFGIGIWGFTFIRRI